MLDINAQEKVRPLCWWSPAQISQIAQRVHPIWEQWLDNWLVDVPSTLRSVDCSAACDSPALIEQAWMPLVTSGPADAWLDQMDASSEPSDLFLFGSPAGARRPRGDSIATALGREADGELRRALCALLDLTPGDGAAGGPKAEVFRPWVGGLIVLLGSKAGKRALRLLLSAQAVGRVLEVGSRHAPPARLDTTKGPRGGLHSVQAALAGKLVQVRVQLSSCELDLGTLTGLQVGDIVPLPHGLDEPLTVAFRDSPFCAGYLGRRGNAKAIELASAAGDIPLTEFNLQ